MRICTPVWVTRISWSSSSQLRVSVSCDGCSSSPSVPAIGVLPRAGSESRGEVDGRVVRVTDADVTIDGLPAGLSARLPNAADAPDVAALLAAAPAGREGVGRRRPRGGARPAGRHRLVDPPAGPRARPRRAARRLAVGARPRVGPHPRRGDRHAGPARGGCRRPRRRAVRRRPSATPSTSRGCAGVRTSLLDSGAYADDPRQQRWLAAAGFEQTRTWLQMTRPVAADEACGAAGAARGRRRCGPVERHDDGLPVAQDLQDVHRVLEESFQDHFSSLPRELPRVRDAAARGPRPPLGPLVARDRRDRRGRVPRRGARVDGAARGRHGASRAATSTTSGCTVELAAEGSRKRCCTPRSRMPRAEGATGSASRSTPTHRPGPTASTRRWAGSPTTAPSPGTASSTCADRPGGLQPEKMSTTSRVGFVSTATRNGRSRSRTPTKAWPTPSKPP